MSDANTNPYAELKGVLRRKQRKYKGHFTPTTPLAWLTCLPLTLGIMCDIVLAGIATLQLYALHHPAPAYLDYRTPHNVVSVGPPLQLATARAAMALISGIAFLGWFFLAHRNLAALRPKPAQLAQPLGWVALSLLIPGVNLVNPYAVMCEVYYHSDPLTLRGKRPWGAELVGWWWGLWLLAYALPIPLIYLVRGGGLEHRIEQFVFLYCLLAKHLVDIFGSLVLCGLISNIVMLQEQRYELVQKPEETRPAPTRAPEPLPVLKRARPAEPEPTVLAQLAAEDLGTVATYPADVPQVEATEALGAGLLTPATAGATADDSPDSEFVATAEQEENASDEPLTALQSLQELAHKRTTELSHRFTPDNFWGKALVVLLGFLLLAQLAVIGESYSQVKTFDFTSGNSRSSENDWREHDDFLLPALAVRWALSAAAIFVLARWVYVAYGNLPALRPGKGPHFSPGDAAVGLFIPLVNLVWPHGVLQELWRESDPQQLGKPAGRGSYLVGSWWVLTILALAMVGSALWVNMYGHRPASARYLEYYKFEILGGMAFEILSVPANLMLGCIVFMIDENQMRRRCLIIRHADERQPRPKYS